MVEATEALSRQPQRVAHTPVFRVQPARRRASLNLRELWEYRELLLFFIWRDVKVRYKQTFFGVAWALIQPLIAMLIFVLVFSIALKVPSNHVPYPLHALTGYLLWGYFSSSILLSSQSVVQNSNLVSKVYFPRLIIPVSAVLVPIVDFFVGSVLLIPICAYYGITPHWHASVSWVFLLMALTVALGVGLWLSALNVRYRDVPFVVPFLIQAWMWASPVFYPVSVFPHSLRWLVALNPMTGVIDGFRWTFFGKGLPEYGVYGTSAGMAIVLVVSGLIYFRRVERRFGDLV